jgi:HK97 gp10 family phage protein
VPTVKTSFKIEGADKIDAALSAIEKNVAKKIARKALREGGKIILKEAKSNAPKESGALKKSIKLRAGKSKKKGRASVVIGTGAKWFQGDQFYGAFLEFGHKAGSRKLGDARKQVEAKPYLAPAGEAKAAEAARKVVDSIWEQLANYWHEGGK